MAVARTVLGYIPAEQLGITLTHEHITFSSGSARRDLGERYDREAYLKQICDDVSAAKRDYNVNTIVCVSTAEMGRDVDICAEVQRRTGVNIIASTGAYRQNGGLWSNAFWSAQTQERFEEFLTKEITEGVGRDRIKCGNIKMGWAAHEPTLAEEKLLRAAGRVSARLGTSIVMHTPYWSTPLGENPGMRMVDILTTEGADPGKITIGHAQGVRRANLGLTPLLEVLRRGAYVCFEDLNKSVEQDNSLIGYFGALIGAGYVEQLMLSLDHQASLQTVHPPENLKSWVQDCSYLHREIIPRMLKAGISEKHIEQMMVTNPKDFLSF